MKLLFVICDRNITAKILKQLNKLNANYHISFYAKGTANSEILSYFGLAETEKEMIMTFVEKDNVENILNTFLDMEYFKNHGAVAFTVPLDGIGRKTLEFLKQMEVKQ